MADLSEGALESAGRKRLLDVEVWTAKGLVTLYLLFVISLAGRVVSVAGIAARLDESWMLQIARNIAEEQSGALHSKRYRSPVM